MKQKGLIRSRLSLKIILVHLLITGAVYVVLFAAYRIALAAGLTIPENPEEFDIWLIFLLYVIPSIFGISIVVFSSYAINKMAVSRIRKLKKATAKVASGDFDSTLQVKGVDELSDLTDSFNKMTAELKANEYLSKDFVRNVSHEYKTPLSVIKAYAESIETETKKKKTDKAALEECAKIIMEEADRLSELSKSIIQLSLLDSTTIIKKEDDFSPAEQIRSILRNMQLLWSKKNIEFDLDLEDFEIKNNGQLLYQVWQNLISNAVKYSNPDSKIKIFLKAEMQELYFEIADDGIGIKAEDKENIFTHFFMGNKSRNSEGSGLGLAIVKKIVDKLGGEVAFESEEGKGTTFKVRLAAKKETV